MLGSHLRGLGTGLAVGRVDAAFPPVEYAVVADFGLDPKQGLAWLTAACVEGTEGWKGGGGMARY